MGNKRPKRRNYKFTEKKHSKKGMAAIVLGIVSLAALFAAVNISFGQRGNGTVYLGSFGLLSAIFGIASFIVAVFGLKDEQVFKILPGIGLGIGVLSTAVWIGIYAIGFW